MPTFNILSSCLFFFVQPLISEPNFYTASEKTTFEKSLHMRRKIMADNESIDIRSPND